MNTLISFFILMCFTSVISKKLPAYISFCHQGDPNLNECFANAIAQVKPHLKNGIPEFQLPAMNPLFLPEASLDNGESFRATFKDIEVFHAYEFDVKYVNVDLKHAQFDMVLGLPRLRIKSKYSITGKLLILQLNGNGRSDGNFTNVEAGIKMSGSKYTKGKKEYFNFNNKSLTLKFGHPVLRFDNLFQDNEELNERTNKIINENIESILEELTPVLNRVISDFVFGLIGRIFSRFSVEELFPK
ncbi:hypothetical protein HHI36_005392 [Cryptolaemus montrouzieri]|uniref:Uncharacterized protein n=1 Tax=Cryptolaemus montrouzieri TaxID=559131 RepID=A0ABD2NU07_9CUCU